MVHPALLSTPGWRALVCADYQGPKIVLVHGLLAGQHMQRHLLQFLRKNGYPDSSLYSNHQRPATIAKDIVPAAQAGRPVVLIGYSQGGSQIIKVAKILKKQNIKVNFAISLAAGGLGRIYPAQWGFNVRQIPDNIQHYLNYFAAADVLGTDKKYHRNLAVPQSFNTRLENIAYRAEDQVDHIGIVRCYPSERVIPAVQELFLDRLLAELAILDT
ncbi:esterase/lipase family protein [Alkanindiges sp. WGS2144]|uniref:esterase/lipase family protein n=1 Tax=Alkanindiges sp. WGS2144 TaxID=3366808 RepID=UPI003753792C